MPGPLKKPPETLRRRNAPEQWVLLPPVCKIAAPKWPAGKPSTAERELWARLWKLPVASWWHEQGVSVDVVSRYVRLAIEKPSLAAVSQMETALALTPSAMARMRLVVEQPEPIRARGPNPYAHIIARRKREGKPT